MSSLLRILKAERERLMDRLDNSGGRGVGLAEDIDSLDRQIAVIESDYNVDAFIDGYIAAIAWADAIPLSANPDHPQYDGTWESGGMQGHDLEPGIRGEITKRAQLVEFVQFHLDDLMEYNRTMSTTDGSPIETFAGYDLYLTRAGHGTGFWDHGLGAVGERLTEAAKSYGSVDDHMLYETEHGTLSI